MGNIVRHPSLEQLMLNDTDISSYLLESEGAVKLKSPRTWEQELIDDIFAPDENKGTFLPWPSMSGFRLRPGELTVWGGYNESRKSLITGQVMLACADQGDPVVIASFEMPPKETIKRMLFQWLGKVGPTRRDISEFIEWAQGKIWIYDQVGRCEASKLFAVMRYAADKLKAKHFVVDSLMRVVRGTDDYSGQKDTVDQMLAIAKDTEMHVHLVAHNKKPQAGEKQSRYSIKGASEISDLAFNVVIIERPEDADGKKPDDKPDAWLKVGKQRNHNWKGCQALFLQGETGAFSEQRHFMNVIFGTLKTS